MSKEENDSLFIDNSGDHKNFTQIPNMLFDNYSATQVGVYGYIKRKTGEHCEYFENKKKTCKQLNISFPTFQKILALFEKDKLIKLKETRVYKTHPVNVYIVLDIWQKNIENAKKRKVKKRTYLKIGKNGIPMIGKNGIPMIGKNGIPKEYIIDKKNPLQEEPSIEQCSSHTLEDTLESSGNETSKYIPPANKFSWDDYLKVMLQDPRKHIRFMAKFFKFKNITYSTPEAIDLAIKRNVKIANQLVNAFSTDELNWAALYCKNGYDPKSLTWNLDTLLKVLSTVDRNSNGIDKSRLKTDVHARTLEDETEIAKMTKI